MGLALIHQNAMKMKKIKQQLFGNHIIYHFGSYFFFLFLLIKTKKKVSKSFTL